MTISSASGSQGLEDGRNALGWIGGEQTDGQRHRAQIMPPEPVGYGSVCWRSMLLDDVLRPQRSLTQLIAQ